MAKKLTYQQTRKLWYKKLQKSGFKDIEHNDEVLKIYSTEFNRKHNQSTREAKQQYYDMATRFLNEYQFKSHLQQAIWEYHSNGIGVRNIAKILKKTRLIDRTGAWVHFYVIRPLREEMKKMYMK